MPRVKPSRNIPNKSPAPQGKSGFVRIISGQWKGRKLPVKDVEGLRPTTDRVKETIFNWLAPHVRGTRCLDLFAGSGALFLEALSRGAAMGQALDASNESAAHASDAVSSDFQFHLRIAEAVHTRRTCGQHRGNQEQRQRGHEPVSQRGAPAPAAVAAALAPDM